MFFEVLFHGNAEPGNKLPNESAENLQKLFRIRELGSCKTEDKPDDGLKEGRIHA
jgi:hypothetical protein